MATIKKTASRAKKKVEETIEKAKPVAKKVASKVKTATKKVVKKARTVVSKTQGIETNAVNKKDFYIGNKGFLYTIELLALLFSGIGVTVAVLFLVMMDNIKQIGLILGIVAASVNGLIFIGATVAYYIHWSRVQKEKLGEDIEVFKVTFKKGVMILESDEKSITVNVSSIATITQNDKWNAKDFFGMLPKLAVDKKSYHDEIAPQSKSRVQLYAYPVEIATIDGESYSVQPTGDKYASIVKRTLGFVE